MQKPLGRRIFVFGVRNRQRMPNKSGLYVPNSSRGNMTRAEDLFVLNPASDCKFKWAKGQHVLVSDGFELEPYDFEFWDQYKDDPEFQELKKFAESVEGNIVSTVIHEDCILAEVIGPCFQEDFAW